MTAIFLPVKSESVFYSDYYITICRTSASMGAFLWTSETCRQSFSGLHCHVTNFTLPELLHKVLGHRGAFMNMCWSAEMINTSKGHMHY